MKLLRLKLDTDFRSLQAGFEVPFLRDFDKSKMWDFMPYCLAGRNGSGKSNILEALAAIFYHIECIYLNYKPEDFEGEKDENGNILKEGFFAEQCTPDAFELEYIYSKKGSFSREFSSDFDIGYEAHILITKKIGEAPKILWLNRQEIEKNEILELTRTEVKNFLPDKVIGYSSGENEILSLPFFKMRFINYDEYEERLRDEKGYSEPEGRLVYLDTQHSQAVFLTNYLMQDEKVLRPIFNAIGVKAIKQFRIIINQNKKVRKYRFEEGNLIEEQSLGEQWNEFFELTELLKQKDIDSKDLKPIDKLRCCATSQFFDEKNKVLYLDYFIDEDVKDENGEIIKNEFGELIGLSEMKKAFRAHFNNDPFELFRAFQILLTLNLYDVEKKTKQDLYKSGSLYVNETVPILASEKRIMRFKDFFIAKENTRGDVLSKALSDGEHQYLHAMGLCLLFKNTNSLFLLDEPETHFNPDWRAKFISTLRDCLAKEEKDKTYLRDLLITSHSPFIISDSHEENVLVFKKDLKTGKVTADRPGFNTFGASVNQITLKIFEKHETIGNYANSVYTNLYERLESGEDTDLLIQKANDELGDSVEKVMFVNKALDKKK